MSKLTISADTYSANNSLQQCDAAYALDNFLHLMKWSENQNMLDVGTGDGVVLENFILRKLPKSPQKITVLDISPGMLKVTKKRFEDKTEFEFVCFDIATPMCSVKLAGHFDHIFSFYCLHWVSSQNAALQNIFNMLKPGGDTLLTIIASDPNLDVYKKMAQTDKWSSYMKDVEKYISPYHHTANSAQKMKKLLKNVGFVNCKCEVVERIFLHDSLEDFWSLCLCVPSKISIIITIILEWLMGINIFIKRLSLEEIDEYKEDYISEMKKIRKFIFENTEGHDGKVYHRYDMLIVFASKPEIC